MRFSTMIIAPAAATAMMSAGPASSGSPSVGVSTIYSTQTITLTQCAPTVTDCPVRSSTIVVPIGTTTTTSYVAPPVYTSSTTPVSSSSSAVLTVPATSAPVCVPTTVTSYVTVCPPAATSIPASSIPYTSIPATSKPATSVPATSVPYTTKAVPSGTGVYVPTKGTSVPYMQANAGTTVQAGSAAIIALAGVVAFFL